MISINTSGHLFQFDSPKVMGIINLTPDSFYAESRKQNIEEIVSTAKQMIADGATFLDLGGMSTKPGAKEISIQEEIDRVLPAIDAILRASPTAIISIDTYRSEVANEALQAGAKIINDISGGDIDEKILTVAAKNNTPYICMHMQGPPQDMQANPQYENVTLEVFKSLQQKIVRCHEAGIKDVIIDLGFGFGKTIEHNYELLKNMDYFQQLDCPILVGLSRKSMLYKPLDYTPKQSLNATTAANVLALQKGANILRVHDVKEAVEGIKIWKLTN
jgi:dihydropteroate synthase